MNWEEAVCWLKNQEDEQELVKACFYDDPLIDAAKRYYESTEWKELKKYLPNEKGKVLDIGAGRGISSYAFAKEGWHVVALEPNPSRIVGAEAIKELAKESGLRIEIVENWGEKLPFDDESFDVVYMRQALHHSKNLAEFCSEAGRVLKSGGFFFATREHVISKKEDLPIFLAKHPLHRLYGGENAYLIKEYLEAIKSGKMEIVHVLKPFKSDINLFPRHSKELEVIIIRFLEAIYAYVPFLFIFSLKNIFNMPGRVYSFIARKL